MKYLIGFIFGIMLASALADDTIFGRIADDNFNNIIILSGVGPDGKMAPIRVDVDGHVICSKETK